MGGNFHSVLYLIKRKNYLNKKNPKPFCDDSVISALARSQINPNLFSNLLSTCLAYHISPCSSKPDTSTKSKQMWRHVEQVNLLIHFTEAVDINYFGQDFILAGIEECIALRHSCAGGSLGNPWAGCARSLQPALRGNHCTESVQLGQDLTTTWNDSWHLQLSAGICTIRRLDI